MERSLRAGLWLIDRLLEAFVALIMLALVGIVALQFIDRYVIDVPIMAPDQFVRVGLIWLTFLGFATAIRAGANVRVDILEKFLPPDIQRWLENAFDAMLLFLLVILILKGWRVVEIGFGTVLLGTPLSTSVPAAALVVGFVLTFLFVALRLVGRLVGSSFAEPPRETAATLPERREG